MKGLFNAVLRLSLVVALGLLLLESMGSRQGGSIVTGSRQLVRAI